jgi:hypothetical protein
MRSRLTWPSAMRHGPQALRLAIAALVLGTLSACNTSGDRQLARSLPAAPSYARPVLTQDPKAGEDALIVAARERMGRAQANCVITNFRDWYDRVRADYAAGGDASGFTKEAEAVCGKFKGKTR